MSIPSLRDMLAATRQICSGPLAEATARLQRALQGEVPGMGPPGKREPPIIDGDATEVRNDAPSSAAPGAYAPAAEALRVFVEQARAGGFPPPSGGMAAPFAAGRPSDIPDGAQFLSGSYTNEAGTRPYKLYVSSTYREKPVPLVVMLHGCKQSPDDFAAGTRMNEAAEAIGCLVLYPGQIASANSSKCWNWFSPGDQKRDRGEPSLLAGIIRRVKQQYAIDPRRVYVAGLSAGGAAAAVMGHAYPDLIAAIGVHSGLACGAAHSLPSALAAMQQGNRPGERPTGGVAIPTIVFHGDRDTTVHPRNAEAIAAQSMPQRPGDRTTSEGRVAGGHRFTVTTQMDLAGKAMLEQWVIHGAGHAWSGGSSAGSYTDPRGPDATREMLRFFLGHEIAGV